MPTFTRRELPTHLTGECTVRARARAESAHAHGMCAILVWCAALRTYSESAQVCVMYVEITAYRIVTPTSSVSFDEKTRQTKWPQRPDDSRVSKFDADSSSRNFLCFCWCARVPNSPRDETVALHFCMCSLDFDNLSQDETSKYEWSASDAMKIKEEVFIDHLPCSAERTRVFSERPRNVQTFDAMDNGRRHFSVTVHLIFVVARERRYAACTPRTRDIAVGPSFETRWTQHHLECSRWCCVSPKPALCVTRHVLDTRRFARISRQANACAADAQRVLKRHPIESMIEPSVSTSPSDSPAR